MQCCMAIMFLLRNYNTFFLPHFLFLCIGVCMPDRLTASTNFIGYIQLLDKLPCYKSCYAPMLSLNSSTGRLSFCFILQVLEPQAYSTTTHTQHHMSSKAVFEVHLLCAQYSCTFQILIYLLWEENRGCGADRNTFQIRLFVKLIQCVFSTSPSTSLDFTEKLNCFLFLWIIEKHNYRSVL